MYEEIMIKSTINETMQPSLFIRANADEKRPLLVGLHTWSFDRFNQLEYMSREGGKYGFHVLLPEFRGPNLDSNPNRTLACGSKYAMQDIVDAVEYVCSTENVDTDNIFLMGGSGGGHMSLMMAGYCPDMFKAIASFCPITDLNKWVNENPNYTKHILACCSENKEEMALRSPVSYVDGIAKANVKIFHGKADPSVPCTHSIDLFNAVMAKYPKSNVYLDIFDGGHEVDTVTGFHWLIGQYKKDHKEKVTS